MSSGLDSAAQPRVSVVIVSHDGARWLPRLLSALEAGARLPDRLVAVDTGSTDDSVELLAATLGRSAILPAPADSGFGAAVQIGLDSLAVGQPPPSNDDWVWLLHDDCAPATDALDLLLAVVAAEPDVSVVGCRVRAWPRGLRLLEVGVTITGTGHRETGLEPGEYDQGQHDQVRSVLSVSSAGMLVRHQVWDQLRGFDPHLPLFRDDVDFGWRVTKAGGRVVVSPDAIMFHAEAATRGVRAIANTNTSPHRADRRAAIFSLLANCSLPALPFQYVRLFLGSLLRALGYLFGKLPSAAYDEVAAMASVLLRPLTILSARARRRPASTASRSSVRARLPTWWTPYLNGFDSVVSRFADSVRDTATKVGVSARTLRSGRGNAADLESGPVSDEAVNLVSGAGPVVWALTHPILCLTGLLTLAGLVASRGLWGAGSLQGGALLPVPDGARDWWNLYTESWHPVALGSTEVTSPYVALLGLTSTALLGKTWLAVDLIMLLAVPLAAIGAFVVARRLVESLGARVWMTTSYALLPVVTGAVTSGHLGTVVATILLPWLLRVGLALVDASRRPSWRPVFASGLVLAAMAAFCPLAWVIAGTLTVVAAPWLLLRRSPTTLAHALAAVLLPIALLAPWSLRFLSSPALLLTEAGVVDPSTTPIATHAWQLPFGRLAAAGDAPWWLAIGVVLAACIALLRADRRSAVAACWLVITVGLGTVAVVSRQLVSVSGGDFQSFAWVGFGVIVVQGAAIVAAGLAADGVTQFIQSGSFGWRQPVAAVTSVVALLSPVAGLAWWVAVAPHGELHRTSETTLPAYIVDALLAGTQQRALILEGNALRIDYQVILDDGVRLGDESVAPEYGSTALQHLIGDMISDGSSADVARLANYGIGYVMLPSPANDDLVTALDGLTGLTRASTDLRQVVGWKVDAPTGLVRILDPNAATISKSVVVDSSSGSANAVIPAGFTSRVLSVAVPPGADFEASVDGTSLADSPGVNGDTRFELGKPGGTLKVGPGGHRGWWLAGQGLLWLVGLVLATPSLAKRDGLEVEA